MTTTAHIQTEATRRALIALRLSHEWLLLAIQTGPTPGPLLESAVAVADALDRLEAVVEK